MKKLLRYVPLHILLCIIIGICLQHFYRIIDYNSSYCIIGSILLLTILYVLKYLKHKIGFLFIFYVIGFLIGTIATFINHPENDKLYYKNFYKKESTVVITCKEVLKSNTNYTRFIGELIQVNQQKTTGDIIVNLRKPHHHHNLFDIHFIVPKASLVLFQNVKNPHAFNYKKHMELQGIYHQIFIDENLVLTEKRKETSILHLASNFRNELYNKLKKHHFTTNQKAIINALLLGQRQDISSGLKSNYIKAGAIHILAISGLHIGILFFLLNFILQWLTKMRHGEIIKNIVVVILLWIFAFITGLSPSLVRATTMFTFIILGKLVSSDPPIEFSLISAMLFMLLIHPMLLFNVGFQLSYLAVFGIVWIQPLLYQLWSSNFYITRKFWQLSTVSIAAQIGTLPISLYYFHQFPGLFLIANLIIIPFLSYILSIGFIILGLAYFDILPNILVTMYGGVISLLNTSINWIASYDDFLFRNIDMPFINIFLWYFLIFFSIRLFQKFNSKRLLLVLTSLIIIQSVHLFQKHKITSKKEFIVFHKNKNTFVGMRNQNTLTIKSNMDSTLLLEDSQTQIYLTKEHIKNIELIRNKNVFSLLGHHIITIDSLGIYPKSKLKKSPIIILQHSPKINLIRLIKEVKPSLIIADGSNYKSYTKHWEKICKKRKTPFHTTYEDGAYIIKE